MTSLCRRQTKIGGGTLSPSSTWVGHKHMDVGSTKKVEECVSHDSLKSILAARLLALRDQQTSRRGYIPYISMYASAARLTEDARTHASSSGRPAAGNNSRTADLENSMSRLGVSSSGGNVRANTAGTSSGSARPTAAEPRATSSRPSGQAFAATGRDSKTGMETRWEVTASSPYTDPAGTTQRQINTKRIREDPNKTDSSTTSSMFCFCFTFVEEC